MLEDAEVLKKDARNLLKSFLEKGPFSAEYTTSEALSMLATYREQLLKAREIEEQLRRDLGLFDISLPESLDLAKLERVKFDV